MTIANPARESPVRRSSRPSSRNQSLPSPVFLPHRGSRSSFLRAVASQSPFLVGGRRSALPPRLGLRSAVLRVVAGAVPVDDHNGLVSDDPGVVAAWKRGDLAGAGYELGAVVHADRELAADVVLEVRRLAAVRSGDRPDVVGPAPAGLERVPADLAVAHVEDLGAAVGELARLVGLPESLVLGLLACACGCHLCLLYGPPGRPCSLVSRCSPASVERSSSLPSIPRQTARPGREPGYSCPRCWFACLERWRSRSRASRSLCRRESRAACSPGWRFIAAFTLAESSRGASGPRCSTRARAPAFAAPSGLCGRRLARRPPSSRRRVSESGWRRRCEPISWSSGGGSPPAIGAAPSMSVVAGSSATSTTSGCSMPVGSTSASWVPCSPSWRPTPTPVRIASRRSAGLGVGSRSIHSPRTPRET